LAPTTNQFNHALAVLASSCRYSIWAFGVEAGRTLAVGGESGCGRSTLARVLTRGEPPSEGRLLVDVSTPQRRSAMLMMEPLRVNGQGDAAVRALMLQPHVLVMDEQISALDV
jgi:ABC-type dipeptide/oligopeptide/nickel transport system ATPase subunit